jgi:hypothetical protein
MNEIEAYCLDPAGLTSHAYITMAERGDGKLWHCRPETATEI